MSWNRLYRHSVLSLSIISMLGTLMSPQIGFAETTNAQPVAAVQQASVSNLGRLKLNKSPFKICQAVPKYTRGNKNYKETLFNGLEKEALRRLNYNHSYHYNMAECLSKGTVSAKKIKSKYGNFKISKTFNLRTCQNDRETVGKNLKSRYSQKRLGIARNNLVRQLSKAQKTYPKDFNALLKNKSKALRDTSRYFNQYSPGFGIGHSIWNSLPGTGRGSLAEKMPVVGFKGHTAISNNELAGAARTLNKDLKKFANHWSAKAHPRFAQKNPNWKTCLNSLSKPKGKVCETLSKKIWLDFQATVYNQSDKRFQKFQSTASIDGMRWMAYANGEYKPGKADKMGAQSYKNTLGLIQKEIKKIRDYKGNGIIWNGRQPLITHKLVVEDFLNKTNANPRLKKRMPGLCAAANSIQNSANWKSKLTIGAQVALNAASIAACVKGMGVCWLAGASVGLGNTVFDIWDINKRSSGNEGLMLGKVRDHNEYKRHKDQAEDDASILLGATVAGTLVGPLLFTGFGKSKKIYQAIKGVKK